VHVFGVAYKKDVGDVRESPALDILELLTKRGAIVSYTDPYAPTLELSEGTLASLPFEVAVASHCDCAVIATDHAAFDYGKIATMGLIVDSRNAIKNPNANVYSI
jgi:UDP-N-acetyl-D-glucosamine dehydrogenase